MNDFKRKSGNNGRDFGVSGEEHFINQDNFNFGFSSYGGIRSLSKNDHLKFFSLIRALEFAFHNPVESPVDNLVDVLRESKIIATLDQIA